MTTATRIQFIASDDAVNTIIRGQHTDLAKALLELIMNSVDSGSRTCHVTLTQEGFVVVDDGQGFGSYENVMERFKELGKAHKENAPTYGRFGMGRGQIMPWGRIQWTSGTHRMVTDLNAYDGFEYSEGPDKPCCTVDGSFYERLSRFEFMRALEELSSQCRFIDGSVRLFINNRVVNTADDEVWDEETDDYRIRWHQSRGERRAINIYNQGVFICRYPDLVEGLGGDVVAKKALKLNMARNSIHPKDPVWQVISARIAEKVRQHRQALSKRKTMSEEMRLPLIELLAHPSADMSEMMLEGWLDHFAQEPNSIIRLPLLRDCRGRYHRFDALEHRPLTLLPDGRDREGEAASLQNLAIPVTLGELRNWGVEKPEALVELYNERVASRLWHISFPHQPHARWIHLRVSANIVPFEVIAAGLDTETVLLKQKDLTPREAAFRNACEYGSGILAKRISKIDGAQMRKRRVVLGEAVGCDGWTDAATFIAINRPMASLLDRGQPGATQIALLMLHEYVHDQDNPDSHEHSELFYERFHNLASDYSGNELVGNVAKSLWQRYLTELNNKGLPLPKVAAGHPEADRALVYTFELGEQGLSVMAKQLLERGQIHHSVRGRTLTLKSNIDYLYSRLEVLRNWLWDGIPKELGLETLTDHNKRIATFETRDDPAVVAARAEYQQTVADAWAAQSGGRSASYLAAVRGLGNRFNRSPESQLIAFMMADPGTHILRYEAEPRRRQPVHVLGGPGYQLEMTPWQHRGIGDYGSIVSTDAYSCQNNAGARAAFLLNRVKDVMASITDPQELESLIETLQSEGFAQELRTMK